MTQVSPFGRSRDGVITDPGAYAVLRRGGATPASASAQLTLDLKQAAAMEAHFRVRSLKGGEQTPRFARHAAHIRAVMAEGGFPALTERRAADGRLVLSAAMTWPELAAAKDARRG